MNKLAKDLINKLSLNPLVEKEDIEKLKEVLKDFYLEKKRYEVLELYKNFSYNAQSKYYDELPYYIWYHMKYKAEQMYLLVDGEVLNPPTNKEDQIHLQKLIRAYENKTLKTRV